MNALCGSERLVARERENRLHGLHERREISLRPFSSLREVERPTPLLEKWRAQRIGKTADSAADRRRFELQRLSGLPDRAEFADKQKALPGEEIIGSRRHVMYCNYGYVRNQVRNRF